MSARSIVAAAIKYDGQVSSLPPPARHHHLILHIAKTTGVDYVGQNEQGFIDSEGQFVDRRSALAIAQQAGQIKAGTPVLSELYSENLW
jgi:hypothetical protein